MQFILTVLDPAKVRQKRQTGGDTRSSQGSGAAVGSAPGQPQAERPWPPTDAFEKLDNGCRVCAIGIDDGPAGQLVLNDTASASVFQHVLMLNKFPVNEKHVVIVTSQFKSQAAPMSSRDVAVLWQVVNSVDGVGFYNGGFNSGASQPRRHMQVIPIPSLQANYPHGSALTSRNSEGDSGSDSTARAERVSTSSSNARSNNSPSAAGCRLPVDVAIAEYWESQGWQGPSPGTVFQLPAFAGRPSASFGLALDGADRPVDGSGPSGTGTTGFPHSVVLLGADVHKMAPNDAGRFVFDLYVKCLKSLVGHTTVPATGSATAAAPPPAPAPWWAVPASLLEAAINESAPDNVRQLPRPENDTWSHNVVLTREWMMVVPRVQECWEGVSINSLGFAGLMLAKGPAKDRIRQHGPLAVLTAVVNGDGSACGQPCEG